MTNLHPTIRAVLFDADGVLQRNSVGWIDRVRALSGPKGNSDNFLRDLFAAERPCLLGEEDFESTLATVLKKWGSTSTVSSALQLWTQIESSEPILDLIHSLRHRGTVVGLATNQQAFRAKYMTNDLGYAEHFDHLFYSCTLGHRKPSSVYFDQVTRLIGFPAPEILFIDDDKNNVEAAKNADLYADQFQLEDGERALQLILQNYTLANN